MIIGLSGHIFCFRFLVLFLLLDLIRLGALIAATGGGNVAGRNAEKIQQQNHHRQQQKGEDGTGLCYNKGEGNGQQQCGEIDSFEYEMGVRQNIDMNYELEINNVIMESRQYIKDVVMIDKRYKPVRPACKNKHEDCALWAVLGECYSNPDYMKLYCAPSCKSCAYLSKETRYLEGLDAFGSEMGVKQRIDDVRYLDEMHSLISQTRKYMEEIVMKEDLYKPVRSICKNKSEKCTFWAVIGECEKNPNFMQTNCAPVCKSCEQLSVESRCPLDPTAIDAWHPGDLNKMFESITTDPLLVQQHQPNIISRPNYANGDNETTADYIIGPWVITMENVITEEESERLIELGSILGYERSTDLGVKFDDGTYGHDVNSGRTSTNTWCWRECYTDPISRRVMERIQNITNIPEQNSEHLQLLRYEVGQFYDSHHDYIPYHIDRQCGVRLMTVYLYLNDVLEGGETKFTYLDVEVTPKRGRAVLWPSVLDIDPNRKDPRTDHKAMPVIKGTKYGANAWLHQRNFKIPNEIGCI